MSNAGISSDNRVLPFILNAWARTQGHSEFQTVLEKWLLWSTGLSLQTCGNMLAHLIDDFLLLLTLDFSSISKTIFFKFNMQF